jgi:succinoglycan biosynthesis transport protein ExoP
VQHVQGVDASGPGGAKPGDIIEGRIQTMKEVLYKQELLTQVAEEFHLYGYDKQTATPAQDVGVASSLRKLVQISPKDTTLVSVSFIHEEPAVTRAVLARLADLFVEENTKTRNAITQSSTEFIQHEMDQLKEQLQAKERALGEFKQSHLGQLPEQMDSNIRAIDRLETEVMSQQEAEKALNLRLESVDKAIREYDDPAGNGDPTRASKDPRLARIKELERKLAGFLSAYKETYPDVAIVRNEITRLQTMTTEDYIALFIDQETGEVGDLKSGKRKLADPYKRELLKQREDILREKELAHLRQARIAADIKKFESRIEGTTVHQQELMSIQRDYENLQKNYDSLLEKKLAVGIAGDLDQMRIIEPASLPSWPEKPNLMLVMFGGLAVGCALGLGSAFGIEIMRRGYVSAEEIEIALGLPVLAAISEFESAWPGTTKVSVRDARQQERLLTLPGLMKGGASVSEEPQVAVAPELVAMWYPRSAVAEQYRVAATRLGLIAGKQKGTVVCMSSALMGEGKTSTALNMAYVLSRDLNRKTVLVDCDLKRPTVRAYTGMESTAGLTEVLLGHKTLDECLEYHEQLGVWVLSAGIEVTGTTALTHVDRLSELIQGLRERFEYIVLDSPPLLPVAEAMLIVRMADVVVHVIRARSTPRDVVANAIKMIGQERAVTVILNGVEAKDTPYSYYNYSSKVYESHHQQLLR